MKIKIEKKKRLKRILILVFICIILLCACTHQEQMTDGNEGIFSAVNETMISSSAVIEKATIEEKKDKYKIDNPWIIKDMTGRKRVLNLGDVDIKDIMIPMGNFDLAAEYSQVVGNHYYFLRKEGKRMYTLYCDRGQKIVTFELENRYSFLNCGIYDGQFYLILTHNEDVDAESAHELAVVDFTSGKVQMIGRVSPLQDPYMYHGKLYNFMPEYDDGDDVAVEILDPKGRLRDKTKIPYPEKETADKTVYIDSIIDEKLYYSTRQKQRKIRICRQDLETGEIEEIFSYQPKSNKVVNTSIEMDQQGVFLCEMYEKGMKLYVIPWSGKKMSTVTRRKVSGYVYNNQYVFYLDKNLRIHKWNRKTYKETIMNVSVDKESILDCTEEGIYIQETTGEHRLLYLDLNGKKLETIWDGEYIEEDWEDDLCGSS